MSLRTALQFTLVALFATTFASHAVAQVSPIPIAPMPRQEPTAIRLNVPTLGPLVLALDFAVPLNTAPYDHKQLFSLSIGLFGGPLDEAPMPRVAPRVIVCAEEEVFQVETPSRPDGGSAYPMPTCTSPAIRQLSCNEMNYTWSYNETIPQKFVDAPPMANGTCGFGPHRVAVASPFPNNLTVMLIERMWPYPLPTTKMASGQEPCGWWLDATPVPQPRHVRPVVMVADVHAFGLRLGSDCALPARSYAVTAVGASFGPCCQSAPAACCEQAGKLAGTWYREVDGMVLAATFHGDEMKLCMTQCDDGATLCFTLTADYAITKEGLIHGVITGVDVDIQRDSKRGEAGTTVGEMAAELQSLVDCPFSFRVKQTSSGIMVSSPKVATEGVGKKELAIICGMYKHAPDGKVPPAKPLKTIIGGLSRCQGPECRNAQVDVQTLPIADLIPTMPTPTMPGAVMPAPRSESAPTVLLLQPLPQYFPPMPTPTKPGCCEVPKPVSSPEHFSPLKPTNIPPGDFGMMADVLSQMLGAPQSCPVQHAGMGSLAPRPLPTPPMPGPIARSMTGTWVRQVGPYQYVVKITPSEITITAKAATELDNGKMVVDGMILTTEYHLARDGVTALGLVTCVDARLEGDFDGSDMNALQEELAKFQKAMTDKPFAMSLRVHDDSLVVGNVRLPEVTASNGASPLTALGGCYSSAGDRPLPKLKPVKAEIAPRACPGLPGQAPPQFYIGPDLPPARLPGQPPVMVTPSPYQAAPPPVTDPSPPPARSAYDGSPPVPTMSPSTPPLYEQPKGKKKKDANDRMQKLLYQSETFGPSGEVRQIQNSWRRFWFNDQPSHLTPERIHGGIL